MRKKQRLRSLLFISGVLLALLIGACDGETIVPEDATDSPAAEANDTPQGEMTDTAAAGDTMTPTAAEPALPTATPMPTEEHSDNGGVLIDSVDVTNLDGTVDVTITGNLPDDCTTVAGVDHEFSLDTSTFNVTVATNRPENQMCAEVLVPFERTVTLPTAELAPGTYFVEVRSERRSFELTAADQQPLDAAAEIAPTSGPAGTTVQVTATGLPSDTDVELGVGRQASEFTVVKTAETSPDGTLNTRVEIPETADVGDPWIVVVITPGFDKVASNTFEVTQAQATFDSADIYLVALEDAGSTGREIGCGDSLIPVEVNFDPTIAPMEAALEELLAVDEEYYGQSGLYNALNRSDLSVQGIDIEDGQAIIALNGELSMAGACDAPRIEAQLKSTARQFGTVDSVSITLNGRPLDEVLSGA